MVKISLGGCERLGMVFADELQGEEGPSSVISSVDGRGTC